MFLDALDLFRMFGTEFSDMTDNEVRKWLYIATKDASYCCLNCPQDRLRAIAFYALHLLWIHKYRMSTGSSYEGEVVTGPMKMKKEGDLTVSFGSGWTSLANTSGVPSPYADNPYGTQYYLLARACMGVNIRTRNRNGFAGRIF